MAAGPGSKKRSSTASTAPAPESSSAASDARGRPATSSLSGEAGRARELHGGGPAVSSAAVRGRRGAGSRGAGPAERDPPQSAGPGLPVLRHARRRQDVDGPDLRQVPQLRAGADRDALPGLRHLPGDRRGARRGCDRDRRGQQQRRRAGARAKAERVAASQPVAVQDLLHRRSAHALDRSLQRLAQDPRGAAAARQVLLRDDRGEQDSDHRALAVPAV